MFQNKFAELLKFCHLSCANFWRLLLVATAIIGTCIWRWIGNLRQFFFLVRAAVSCVLQGIRLFVVVDMLEPLPCSTRRLAVSQSSTQNTKYQVCLPPAVLYVDTKYQVLHSKAVLKIQNLRFWYRQIVLKYKILGFAFHQQYY